MRVAYISQWYSPEPEGPAVWIPEGLVELGIHVEVITGIPNYPTGKAYKGYSAHKRSTEEINGIRIFRCPMFPSHDSSIMSRLLNYLSFTFSAAIFGGTTIRKSDIVLVYSSPATVGLVALFYRLMFKKKYILVVQDLWPESILQLGDIRSSKTGKALYKAWMLPDKYLAKYATSIVVISPGMKSAYEARGVPSEKISIVYNWVDEKTFFSQESQLSLRDALTLQAEDFLMLYAGNQGEAQDLDNWIHAMRDESIPNNVHLAFVGQGTRHEELVRLSRESEVKNIHFQDSVDTKTIVSYLRDADALLVSLSDDPLFKITIPSKLQAYMAAGGYIVGSLDGDAADVIRNANCGVVVIPGDVAAMSQAICKISNSSPISMIEKRENSFSYYESHFSKKVNLGKLHVVLAKALVEEK
jgi:colanic acid biosynthesis glycosyl transferase WcaI